MISPGLRMGLSMGWEWMLWCTTKAVTSRTEDDTTIVTGNIDFWSPSPVVALSQVSVLSNVHLLVEVVVQR
jgi:hypothetical protein